MRILFDWSEIIQMQVHISETKELAVDLKSSRSPVICPKRGAHMEIVQDYKYLGVHLHNKLGWAKDSLIIYIKGQSKP